MSDIQDERLEAMLKSRRPKPADPELAQRIVLRAKNIPQTQTLPFLQSVRRLFGEFHLPQPAYVLACTLIVGLAVGFSAPVDTAGDDAEAAPVQSFLYAEDDPL